MAAMALAGVQFQARVAAKNSSRVLTVMVRLTAMPYAPANCLELGRAMTSARQPAMRSQLTLLM